MNANDKSIINILLINAMTAVSRETFFQRVFDSYAKTPLTNLDIKNVDIRVFPECFSSLIDIKTLSIDSCNLESLENLPPHIEVLDVSNNMIHNIDNITKYHELKILNISNNPIKYADLSKMYNIDCLLMNNTAIEKIIYPPFVRNIDCHFSNLNTIDNLPNSVQSYYCSNMNKIVVVGKLPTMMTVFDCENMKNLNYIEHLPKSLVRLKLTKTAVTNMPKFPSSLEHIDISDNKLRTITNIPINFKTFKCSGNYNLCLTSEQKKWLNQPIYIHLNANQIENFINKLNKQHISSIQTLMSRPSNNSESVNPYHYSQCNNEYEQYTVDLNLIGDCNLMKQNNYVNVQQEQRVALNQNDNYVNVQQEQMVTLNQNDNYVNVQQEQRVTLNQNDNYVQNQSLHNINVDNNEIKHEQMRQQRLEHIKQRMQLQQMNQTTEFRQPRNTMNKINHKFTIEL